MRFDELGLLITSEPGVGALGDSCAETSRYALLSILLNSDDDLSNPPMYRFISDLGVLRHPDSPWREDDTSEDQKLPFYLVLSLGLPLYPWCLDMYKQQDKLWWLKEFTGVRTLVQSLIFKFPYRWDDGHKRFQKTSDSSCDYLNFFAQLAHAHITDSTNILHKLAMKLVSKDTMKAKIVNYYGHSPENQWLIDLYMKAIDLVYQPQA